MKNIPFVDLHNQYLSIKDDVDRAIESVIKETAFIRGPYVQKFEEDFASKYDVKHCIPVANGTDAIYIALKMLGIGAGDEVITTAHSWISTSETIVQVGAKPIFVDVDDYFTIDTSLIAEKVTDRTKAIIPVHLFGQPANMGAIISIAKKYQLAVIEDCAQAHFAQWNGKKVGTIGDVGTFSFYPGKNLGAYGDAGAIITSVDQLADDMRMYANHGALVKHKHQMNGINSRMDGLQAAILSAKLPNIHEWNRLRNERANWYNEGLADLSEISLPKVREESAHVYHLYVIKLKNRDQVREKLKQLGIQTVIHYPTALPLLDAYKDLGHLPSDFPVAFKNSKEILSLPLFPEMTYEQVDYVVESLKSIMSDLDPNVR